MKKLLLVAVSLILLGNLTFAQEQEIVRNSKNEEIVLKTDKTWESLGDYHRKMEFQKMVKIEKISVNSKQNKYRNVSFDIVNYSRYDLEYVVYKIKFAFGDEYSLRKIINVNNIKAGKKITVNRLINVDEIDGRDMVIEVVDFKMKTR